MLEIKTLITMHYDYEIHKELLFVKPHTKGGFTKQDIRSYNQYYKRKKWQRQKK